MSAKDERLRQIAGEESIPDTEVLRFAVAEDRAVLALNGKHFIRLHRSNPRLAS